MKKYELTENCIKLNGRTLYQIKALKELHPFTQAWHRIKKGDLGGFIEKEENLSQKGTCWVFENAYVYDNAKVCENATIGSTINSGLQSNIHISQNAIVKGDTYVNGLVHVCGNAVICEKAFIHGPYIIKDNVVIKGTTVLNEPEITIEGNAVIEDGKDVLIFKNWWSSGRYFTYTRSNKKWHVGCFCGTGKQLIQKAYQESKEKGREYEHIVNKVEYQPVEIRNLNIVVLTIHHCINLCRKSISKLKNLLNK